MDLQWNNALCGNTSLRRSDSHHRRHRLHPSREPKQSHKGSRGTKQQLRELSQEQSLRCAHVKEEQQRKKLGLNEPRHSCRGPKSRAACSLCHHHVYQPLQLLLGGIQTPPFVTGHKSASTVQPVANKPGFELFYCMDKDKWKKCRSNQQLR